MRLYKFTDLVRLGVISNWVTLRRWELKLGFPRRIKLGMSAVAWPADAVDAWILSRADASKR